MRIDSLSRLSVEFPCVQPCYLSFVRVAQNIVQIGEIHPNGILGLMVGVSFDGQFAANLPQCEVVHEFVHALAGAGEPIVDGGDGIDHLAQDAGFLMHFAHCRLLRRLAFFDVSLRQTPFQMSASRMTCDDRHATFVVEHQPARRIFAYHRQFLRVERCERGRSVCAAPPWHHRRRRRARRDDRPLLQRHRLRCVQQFVRFQRILGMVVRSIGKHACKICGRNHDSNHTQFCVQVE